MIESVRVVVDLQFGSTGKGLIAGYLAARTAPDTVMTAWAANAGHTYVDAKGRRYVHTMLANGVVSPGLAQLMIGPGSIIDPVNLQNELESCRELLHDVTILIHPHAAVITAEHRQLEQGPMTKIGSTKKGVGEAAIQRIRRDPDNQNVARVALQNTTLAQYVASIGEWGDAIHRANRVQVEGAQGVGLSLYHGFYPYVTSRDVSTYQILADVGLPFDVCERVDVIGTMRTYPIRVANRYDDSGKQVGWSGPCWPDQHELDWERDLGLTAELTTVTKLPRRIFTLSYEQLRYAVELTGCDALFLNFANYLNDEQELLDMVERLELICPVRWIGMGPTDSDVLQMGGSPDDLRRRLRMHRQAFRGAPL